MSEVREILGSIRMDLQISNIVSAVMHIIAVMFYYSIFFKKRELHKTGFLCCFFLAAALSVGKLYLNISPEVNLILSVCLYIGVSFVFYTGSIKNRLFSTAIFVIIAMLSEIIAQYSIELVSGISYNDVSISTQNLFAPLSMAITIVILLYVKRIHHRSIENIPCKYLIPIMLVPVVSIAIILIVDKIIVISDGEGEKLIIPLVLMLLYVNFIMFDFIESYSNKIKAMEIQTELAVVKAQIKHYNDITVAQAQTRKLKHDLSNHIISIKSYVEDGKKDECLKYLDSLTDYANINSDIIDTGNSVIDAIFTAKRNLARERSIDFSADIQIPENLKINSSDCCVIFGNALDNAIEACDKVQGDKYIKVSLIYQNGSLMCKIANSMSEAKNPLLKTTKADKINHGIGLKNIRETLNKYSNMLRVEQNAGEFVLSFIIYEIDNS